MTKVLTTKEYNEIEKLVKPKTDIMKTVYVATIKVAVIAENPYEACDAMSGAMSENLITSGAIQDWQYAELGEPEKIFTDKGELSEPYNEGDIFN